MKQLLLIACTLFVTTFAFAAEEQPKQQIQLACGEKAVQAAALLFQLNTEQAPTDVKVELVDLAHVEEGGYEVYDVLFTVGEITYLAYRVTANIDGCKIINFEMPFAN